MLHGHVTGQALQIDTPVIAADSLNYITARFTFSPDWNGLTEVTDIREIKGDVVKLQARKGGAA